MMQKHFRCITLAESCSDQLKSNRLQSYQVSDGFDVTLPDCLEYVGCRRCQHGRRNPSAKALGEGAVRYGMLLTQAR